MNTKKINLAMIIALLFSACNFDLTDIEARQDELEARLIALENWKNEMNTMVNSLHDLVAVVESRDMISNMESFTDANGSGYKISFVHADAIYVYHGKNGESFEAPVLSVVKENDIFYWVQTIPGQEPKFVLDADGNKLEVDKGDDAKTPEMGIDSDGYWTIDYSDGRGPQPLLNANGEKVKGEAPEGLSCLFSSIKIGDTYIEFILAGGGSFKVPIYKEDEPDILGTIEFPSKTTETSSVFILKDGMGVEYGLCALEYNPKVSTTERILVFYTKTKEAYENAKGIVVKTGDTLSYMGNIMIDMEVEKEYTTVTVNHDGTVVLGTTTAGSGKLIWEELLMTDIEGTKYQTIKLGGNIWTQTNLQTQKYRDGSNITTGVQIGSSNNATAGCAIYNYLDANTPDEIAIANKLKYGLIYSLKAINPATNSIPLAPEGWEIPTAQDWISLINTAANIEEDLNDYMIVGNVAAKYDITNLQAGRLTGFNALLGGWKNIIGTDGFRDETKVGYFASATNNLNTAGKPIPNAYIFMKVFPNKIERTTINFGAAMSVRCVRK